MSNFDTSLKNKGHNESYALIVANGASCSKELLAKLLSENPFIIVLDGAIHRFIDLRIHFDVLLGDFDRNSIDFEAIRALYPNVAIVHAENQEKTDLEKAIDYLIENDFKKADVIWATGMRADHNITNITNLCRYRGKLDICLLDDYSHIQLLPRLPEKFTQSYSKGTPISLIPVGKVEGISTKNLKYPLHHETLTMGYRTGSSNEVLADGMIEITYEKGDLLLMECHD